MDFHNWKPGDQLGHEETDFFLLSILLNSRQLINLLLEHRMVVPSITVLKSSREIITLPFGSQFLFISWKMFQRNSELIPSTSQWLELPHISTPQPITVKREIGLPNNLKANLYLPQIDTIVYFF